MAWNAVAVPINYEQHKYMSDMYHKHTLTPFGFWCAYCMHTINGFANIATLCRSILLVRNVWSCCYTYYPAVCISPMR